MAHDRLVAAGCFGRAGLVFGQVLGDRGAVVGVLGRATALGATLAYCARLLLALLRQCTSDYGVAASRREDTRVVAEGSSHRPNDQRLRPKSRKGRSIKR